MKASSKKLAKTAATPVLQKTLHRVRTRGEATAPSPKSKKRAGIFSKSRDRREDRGERQIKTARSSQTFSRGR